MIFSCDPDEETLPLALELLGDGQVMYASDYPHWDAMTPWVKIVTERTDPRETSKKKILGENAARFYGLRWPRFSRVVVSLTIWYPPPTVVTTAGCSGRGRSGYLIR